MASKSLFASYEVVYRITQCKKSHTTGENLILSAPTDNAKQLSGSLCLEIKRLTDYKKMFMFWGVFFVVLWLMQFC
jgi:hypothetical protein